jgi:RNA polymerase sigma factor (TIGR02999 family)
VKGELTHMLKAAAEGDRQAEARLVAAVYDELRHVAAGRLAGEASGRSVQVTDLVHEAYQRLFGGPSPARFENRAHFFAAASEAMRRILVDRARARRRIKRGGGRIRIELDDVDPGTQTDPGAVLALDEALSRFEKLDPRGAEIVKLRCFMGLTVAEVAEALGVATRTVDRDWVAAKAWLRGELGPEEPDPDRRKAPTEDA